MAGTYKRKPKGSTEWKVIDLSAIPQKIAHAPHMRKTVWTPATWAELHTYQPTGDPHKDGLWLSQFNLRVASLKCACRKDWLAWLAEHPARFTDWFAWTVEAHNAVNARLGKPILTLEQARAAWPQSGAAAVAAGGDNRAGSIP